MVIEFAGLLESLAATSVILRHHPSAVEVMRTKRFSITPGKRGPGRDSQIVHRRRSCATLCVEFYADRKEDLPPRLSALEQDLRARNLGYRYRMETDPAEQARVWSLREAALGLSMAMKEDAKSIPFVEEYGRRAGSA